MASLFVNMIIEFQSNIIQEKYILIKIYYITQLCINSRLNKLLEES